MNFVRITTGLLFFISSSMQAQDSSLLTKESIDTYIKQAMHAWKIPGVAVCIVKDGAVFYQQAIGVQNWETGTLVNEETLFPLASVSKTFTGALFATLEAEGKISLNDPVKKWLPYFSMKNKLYEQQLTLTDILSHRSGWKTFQGDLLNTECSMDYPTMIKKFGNQEPAYPIRTKFGYSNFGFIMAGESIKYITQLSWQAYISQRLLSPLQMNRTYTTAASFLNESNISAGHTISNDSLALVPIDKIEPYSHGGVYSSIRDMGKWMLVLLNKGKLNGTTIIPEAAINKMWQSTTIIGKSRSTDRQFYFKTYGLGWEIMHYQQVEVMQHSGAYSGALSSIALVPALNMGIVILTNQDNHMLHETLKWQFIDAILKKNAPNYTASVLERQKKRQSTTSGSTTNTTVSIEAFAVSLDAVLGDYECDAYGKLKITKKNGKYLLKMEFHQELEGELSLFNKNQLLCTYNHPMFGKMKLPFTILGNKVESFTLYVDGFVETDGYKFIKIHPSP